MIKSENASCYSRRCGYKKKCSYHLACADASKWICIHRDPVVATADRANSASLCPARELITIVRVFPSLPLSLYRVLRQVNLPRKAFAEGESPDVHSRPEHGYNHLPVRRAGWDANL